jgi:hypothetical protein
VPGDAEENGSQRGEPLVVRLKPWRELAAGEAIVGQGQPALAAILCQRRLQGIPGDTAGQAGGIGEGKIHALAKLGTHRVTGIAEQDDSIPVPATHPDIAVTGREHLAPVRDLIEQGLRAWRNGEDPTFPFLQRTGADGDIVRELDALEEADQGLAAGKFGSRREEPEESPGAMNNLEKLAFREGSAVLADEPMCSPRIPAIDPPEA